MFGVETTTKTEDTLDQYKRRVNSIIKHAGDPVSWPEWMERKYGIWSYSTFRTYKAAASAWLLIQAEEAKKHNPRKLLIIENILDQIKNIDVSKYKKRGSAGSSLRAKNISDEESLKIINKLHEYTQQGRKYAPMAVALFYSTPHLGFRPCEWLKVENDKIQYENGRPYIRVKNAKETNGRSHGEYRTLNLEKFDSDHIKYFSTILEKIYIFKIQGKDDYLIKQASKMLRKARQELWPRRKKNNITLYSCRHQFAGNAKKFFGSLYTATMMGHGIVDTCHRSYGYFRKGGVRCVNNDNTISMPQPDMNEMKRVRASKRPSFDIERIRPSDNSLTMKF